MKINVLAQMLTQFDYKKQFAYDFNLNLYRLEMVWCFLTLEYDAPTKVEPAKF